MHPVHFWFIHDLRAYKKAMIALAEKASLVSKSSDGTIRGYRPDVVEDHPHVEFNILTRSYLSASGYDWPNEAPYKLQFLRDYGRDEWTRKELVQKIPDFAFRLPQSIVKAWEKCKTPFEVIFMVCISPILALVYAVAMCLKGIELSFGYMGKFINWGLKKAIPENLPESRVLGTETTQKKLPAQTTQ